MTKIFKVISLDLLIILIWTISTYIVIINPNFENTIIRAILGSVIILFIPGYVLVSALFPKKKDLNIVERIILSIGLSISFVTLLVFAISFIFGIRLIPILYAIYIYIIVLVLIANKRRQNEDEKFYLSFYRIYVNIIGSLNMSKIRTENILIIILIILIISSIGTISYVIISPKTGERFTEFYILNYSGKADNYRANMNVNSPAFILVGITNHEFCSVNYTLQIKLDKNLLSTEKLRLNHGEIWQKNVTFTPNKKGTDMKLEFLLFKENNFTIPYRELHIWSNSK